MMLKTYLKTRNERPGVFAKRIGLSEACVSRLVNGSRQPSASTMERITRATRGAVTLADFRRQSKRDTA